MHVNDTFGQAMAKGIGAILPTQTQLPFKIVETILVRSGGEGPDRRGRQGEGDESRFPAARLPPERLDHPAPRDGEAALEPDGCDQPGLARHVRGAVLQVARQARRLLHLERALVQPERAAHEGRRESVPQAESRRTSSCSMD
jgi:hypothetical protein